MWRKIIALLGLIGGLSLAALPLVRDDGPFPADAIVVIGGDHKPERLQGAAELFRAGYAPIVVLSGGTVVAEVMRRQALALGLPEDALVIEDGSRSTFQNAYCTKAILAARGLGSVLLVTSVYHSRRAGRILGQVFGAEVALRVQPAPSGACRLCWWFQRDQARVVLYEYYNWGRYWLGVRLSNEIAPAAGCARAT